MAHQGGNHKFFSVLRVDRLASHSQRVGKLEHAITHFTMVPELPSTTIDLLTIPPSGQMANAIEWVSCAAEREGDAVKQTFSEPAVLESIYGIFGGEQHKAPWATSNTDYSAFFVDKLLSEESTAGIDLAEPHGKWYRHAVDNQMQITQEKMKHRLASHRLKDMVAKLESMPQCAAIIHRRKHTLLRTIVTEHDNKPHDAPGARGYINAASSERATWHILPGPWMEKVGRLMIYDPEGVASEYVGEHIRTHKQPYQWTLEL